MFPHKENILLIKVEKARKIKKYDYLCSRTKRTYC